MRITIKRLLIIACSVFLCILTLAIINAASRLNDRLKAIKRRNIFFLETSHLKEKVINLTSRQCCAIESAARMNPNMNINIFIFGPASAHYSHRTANIISLFKEYENTNFQKVSIEDYVNGTLVENWWHTTHKYAGSHWFILRAIDILKYLVLLDFGGIYLDLDVVVLASLEDLQNFVGAEDPESIGESAVGFDSSDIGNQYARICLEESLHEWYSGRRIYNKPSVLSRFVKKLCNITYFDNETDYACNNKTLTVFKPATFYPIPVGMYKQYFDREQISKDETMNVIEGAKAIHLYNDHSYSELVEVGSNAPYGLIANKYCPIVYANSGQFF